MNTPTPEEFCEKTKPCEEGQTYVLLHPTMAEAWDKCPRLDWMLWALGKLEVKVERKTLRLFAVWCARNTPLPNGRKTGELLKDPRSLAALEVAERYAHGNATDNELRAAWAAARPAALDAAWPAALDAAWSAARPATLDAAWSAARAAAEDAAEDAAWSAAWYAARAAAWSAAWARAALRAALRALAAAEAAQADQLRKIIPNPFTQGGSK